MKAEYNSEQIEAYLKGHLTKAEEEAIRQQMDGDPGFRQEVKLHQLTIDGLNYVVEKDIEAVLSNKGIKRPAILKKKKRVAEIGGNWLQSPVVLKRMAFTAAFLVLLWPTYEFVSPMINQNQKIEQRIAAQQDIDFSVAGENEELLIQGQKAFNDKNHSEAIQYFNQYLENSGQEDFEVVLYRAISYRLTDKFEEAIDQFQYLESTSSQHYSGEEASWQLALAYVQDQQYESARAQLNKILAKPNHGKRKEVRQLKRLIRFR